MDRGPTFHCTTRPRPPQIPSSLHRYMGNRVYRHIMLLSSIRSTTCFSEHGRHGRGASPYMVDMVEAKPTRRRPFWCCEANNTTIHLAILVTYTCIYRLFIYIWLASPDIIIYTKPATPTPRPARALLLPGPSLNANHSSVERVYRARIPLPC
ncbi:hypothetical protein BT67DRAFT_15171 [Trichocladium antarcticum]|uniref:Uncharacterized protein n=1 Tax=Trichocladium antarcticum TaxID=1450529 RepID=A0AAN6UTG2_9PEZI|nr:hypothetical protein BT67DRAFT_15171 [Trichocladium antarcticum]